MREAPVKTTGFRQGIVTISSTKKERLGTLRILEDGRKFRYSKAGGTLVAGKSTAAAAIASQHITGAVAALNTSRTQVEVTVTAGTAIASNALAGGYLQVETGTGEGRTYRIESNTALTAAGTSITLALTDRMAASDGTTKVALVHNEQSGVIVSATPEALCTGIPAVDVTDGYYFWSQTGGPALALISGTPAIGSMLTMGATDGALAAINATLDIDQPIVGTMWGTVGVDGEYKPVFLTID